MKRIINLFLISLISFTVYAQVDYDQIITSKYASFYEWDGTEYASNGSDWMTTVIEPFQDYYLITLDGETKSTKGWWEYSGQSENNADIYFTEQGRKFAFFYEEQMIAFYYDYNEKYDRYETYVVFTKLQVESK